MTEWSPKFKLNSHQIEAVTSILKHWNGEALGEPVKKVMVVACTAFGKTITASRLMWLANKRGYKSLFLVDRDELVSQTVKKLYEASGIIASIEKAEDKASLESEVVVASIQSLSSADRLARFPKNHFKVIIVDECHLSMSSSWQKVLKYFDESNSANFVGFTATPARGDRKNLMSFWGTIAYKMNLFDGIENGLVTPIKVHQLDLSGVDLESIEIDCEEQVALGEAMKPLWDYIIDEWAKVAGSKKTLWFHPSVASSIEFTKRLVERGFSAKHISCYSKDRKEVIEQFAFNKFQNLNNAMLLTTGYDEPQVECVVPLRAMRSKVQYQQIVGRGIRLYCPNGCRDYRSCSCEGKKNHLILIDAFGCFPELSVMTPADLCSDAPEQVEAIKARMKGKQGVLDLKEQSVLTAKEREQALLSQLKWSKKHGRKTVYDAVHVAALYGDHDLFDFDPRDQGPWAEQPPFPHQLKFLLSQGVSPDSIVNRGHAYKIITKLNESRKKGSPTILQLGRLHELGIDSKGMTKEQATNEIKKHGKRTVRH